MMGSMGDHALQSDEPIAHISEDGRVHSLRERRPGRAVPADRGLVRLCRGSAEVGIMV
jgi:hypothetical protein